MEPLLISDPAERQIYLLKAKVIEEEISFQALSPIILHMAVTH